MHVANLSYLITYPVTFPLIIKRLRNLNAKDLFNFFLSYTVRYIQNSTFSNPMQLFVVAVHLVR